MRLKTPTFELPQGETEEERNQREMRELLARMPALSKVYPETFGRLGQEEEQPQEENTWYKDWLRQIGRIAAPASLIDVGTKVGAAALTKPFREVERPVTWKPGEPIPSDLARYEAWEAPKYVKGLAENIVQAPLLAIGGTTITKGAIKLSEDIAEKAASAGAKVAAGKVPTKLELAAKTAMDIASSELGAVGKKTPEQVMEEAIKLAYGTTTPKAIQAAKVWNTVGKAAQERLLATSALATKEAGKKWTDLSADAKKVINSRVGEYRKVLARPAEAAKVTPPVEATKVSYEEAVQQARAAIKATRSTQVTTAKLRQTDLGKRTVRAEEILAAGRGTEAFKLATASFKGSLPAVIPDDTKLVAETIEKIAEAIRVSPKGWWGKKHAEYALQRWQEGKRAPESSLKALEEILGKEETATVQGIIDEAGVAGKTRGLFFKPVQTGNKPWTNPSNLDPRTEEVRQLEYLRLKNAGNKGVTEYPTFPKPSFGSNRLIELQLQAEEPLLKQPQQKLLGEKPWTPSPLPLDPRSAAVKATDLQQFKTELAPKPIGATPAPFVEKGVFAGQPKLGNLGYPSKEELAALAKTELPKATVGDKFFSWYYNAILSSPKTQIVNSFSNLLNIMKSPLERGAIAAVERPLAKLQGRPVERFFGEVPADIVGAFKGLPEAVRAFLFTMKSGVSPAEIARWEFKGHAFGGKLGRAIELPGTMLKAADIFFYSLNYRAALNATAYRMAARSKDMNLVGTLLEHPTDTLIAEATKVARSNIFADAPGHNLASFIQWRNKFAPLRLVLPFVQTPTNLVKYGLARSPIAILNPRLIGRYGTLAKKSPEAADQIGRWAIGSAMAGAVAAAFAEGKITGSYPTNSTDKQRWIRDGIQPFSVKIGNRWVSYQRLEPFNQLLSQVAAVTDAVKYKEELPVPELAAKTVSTISRNLTSQTYLTSLSNLLDAVYDPERNADAFFEQYITALMPASSLLRTAAQAIDPTVRAPEGLVEKAMANLPGLSKLVPERTGAFGEPQVRESPAWLPVTSTVEKPQAKAASYIEAVHRASLKNAELERKLNNLREQGKTEEVKKFVLENPEIMSDKVYGKIMASITKLEETRTKIAFGLWEKQLNPQDRAKRVDELNKQILNLALAWGDKEVEKPQTTTTGSKYPSKFEELR